MDSKYLVLIGLGFELVVLVVGFLYFGQWLDQRLGWPGYGVAGGAVMALVVWLIHVVQAVKALESSGE